jgi:hypothetical protein
MKVLLIEPILDRYVAAVQRGQKVLLAPSGKTVDGVSAPAGQYGYKSRRAGIQRGEGRNIGGIE